MLRSALATLVVCVSAVPWTEFAPGQCTHGLPSESSINFASATISVNNLNGADVTRPQEIRLDGVGYDATGRQISMVITAETPYEYDNYTFNRLNTGRLYLNIDEKQTEDTNVRFKFALVDRITSSTVVQSAFSIVVYDFDYNYDDNGATGLTFKSRECVSVPIGAHGLVSLEAATSPKLSSFTCSGCHKICASEPGWSSGNPTATHPLTIDQRQRARR